MPVVEESLLIRAPQEPLFDLAQDYRLRLKWDPFLRTEVTFRYLFETRWRGLRWLLDPCIGWVFGRDIRQRLSGLKRGAEKSGLLAAVAAR